MTAFCICAGLIGLTLGCRLRFAAMVVTVLLTSGAVMAACLWHGLTFGQVLWAGFLCHVFIEFGYGTSLLLQAWLLQRHDKRPIGEAGKYSVGEKGR